MQDVCQNTVIGRDKPRPGGVSLGRRLDGDRPALAPDAGIDDGKMNRAWRKRANGVGENGGGRREILAEDLVSDVDQRGFRRDRQHGALHLRDIAVGQSEIGRERDTCAFAEVDRG